MSPPTRPVSVLSHKSFASSMQSGAFMSATFLDNDRVSRKLTDFGKLLAIMAPLIIALITLASMSMYQANNEMTASNAMVESLQKGEAIREVVDSLQRERGMSCVYMNSLGTASANAVFEKVLGFRQDTDKLWIKVTGWIGDDRLTTKEDFNPEINNFRSKLAIKITECAPVLDYYTNLIDYLLGKMMEEFTQSSEGKFWVTLDAYYSLLKVKDLIGLKRATGGAFFASAQYDIFTYQTFIGLTKTAEYLFHAAENTLPRVAEEFKNMQRDNVDLIDNLNMMEEQIFSGNSTHHESNAERSQAWFFNMTEYMTLYTTIESDVNDMLEATLQTVSDNIKFNFNLVLGIVITMAIVCPPSLAIYSISYQSLMNKIKAFTTNIQSKQRELTKEKQKTEVLLHQLLPKAIATDLLSGRPVAPEHFEAVTVFFSDIKGFTSLSASSTPFQITEFLNALYSNCDAILELYDCYKVETIGDAYLVASGVPHRNQKHSEHICTMSLDLLRMMANFPIPHRPWENLLMRIGCHTGPLAAGVVGLKMPRYCLFGDTVNTGARMESTGFPNRIQISQACKEHLDINCPGQFKTQFRHSVPIKGKGDMNTYWVMGKAGFTFTIDLENTERVLEATDYWRLGEDGVK